ncbi:hypothetical protein [Defluviimonas salinarum]|uniref:AcrB/AcrD/AcrF family protein n=1 Tax=Defluviimonas salinarum TaxID=2992147 RepID=A0ABT3J528_9RHOB|nr:hypothetical protein [Defluviimonas salinarum]MCW3782768.1 hypothetical protein [Defluviimonas salinarum]
MVAYASLSAGNVKGSEHGSGAILDKDAHGILLGTLKKVESKNANLATIIALILGFSLNATMSQSVQYLKVAGAVGSFVMLMPLYFSLAGMRQIDQHDFLNLPNMDRERVMQRELMRDLLNKERMFRMARALVLGISLFLVSVTAGGAVIGKPPVYSAMRADVKKLDVNLTVAAHGFYEDRARK